LGGLSVVNVDAGHLCQPQGRLPERDGATIARLHAVHEVEHIARSLAREAVKEAFSQVNTTARPLIIVEGAEHLGLVALADDS
jgi:hypothetical protein